jgi:hypothetical protein
MLVRPLVGLVVLFVIALAGMWITMLLSRQANVVTLAVSDYADGTFMSIELEARAESNERRVRAKHAVVSELLAGQLTLREAAARFRELDAHMPVLRDLLLRHHPGVSYEVASCRQVLEYVQAKLEATAPEFEPTASERATGSKRMAQLQAERQALEAEAGARKP